MAFLFRLGFLFVLIVTILTLPLPPVSLFAQTEQSDWIKPESPTITTLSSDLHQNNLPTHRDKECLPETKFITRPKNILKGYSEVSHQACATRSAFGFHSSLNGYTRMSDSNVAGQLRNSSGVTLTATAIPNSNHLIYSSGGLYGSYRYIVKDFQVNHHTKIQSDGTIQHWLNTGVTGAPIKDSRGAALELRDLRFSSNGKWLIGDVPFRGMTRVNIETGETLMFGRNFDYSIGLNPDLTSAISGDGRYVLISEPKYNLLKIYDLANCQSTNDPIKKSCAEKDLLPFAKSQIADYSEVWSAQFSTNYSMRVYVRKKYQNNQYFYDYKLLTAAGHQESGMEYLALGDSFASGEGAHNYKLGTDTERPFNKCHLSALSYPYLISARSGLNSAESIACSGAKMKDIFSPNQTDYNQHLKQSENKESASFDDQIYNSFLAGYRTQDSFIAKNKPLITTLSISGNDIGFGKILLACIMPGTCYQNEQEKLDLAYTINSKFDELVATYQQVKSSAATEARIYVMGYPSLAAHDGNCALNVHLDRDEIIFSNQIINHLNNVIQRAAAKAGVYYINVEEAFGGKRLCEAHSSEVAVNGLTVGDDKTFSVPLKLANESLDVYLTGRESYHPNKIGHELYADIILEATDGFKMKNPAPDFSSHTPELQNPNNLTPKRIEFNDSLSNDFLPPGERIPVSAGRLKPLSDVSLSIDSQPINPETAKTDQNGNLSSIFMLPGGIEPGLRTLYLHGYSSSGEALNIQKLVYVIANQDDIDGDGLPNDQEKCLLVTESSVDEDQDGVDDACDNQILEPSDNESAPASRTHRPSTEKAISRSDFKTLSFPAKNLEHHLSPAMIGETREPSLVRSNLHSLKTSPIKSIKNTRFSIWAIIASVLLLIGGLRLWKKRLKR